MSRLSLRRAAEASQTLHRCPPGAAQDSQKPHRRQADVSHKPLESTRKRLGVFKNLPGGPWVYSRRLGDFSQKPPSSVTELSQLPLGRTPETNRKSARGILDVPLKYPRRSSGSLLRSDRCLSEVPQKSHSGSTEVTPNTPGTSVRSLLGVSQAILSGL